jgi:hypothetical protein
MRPGQLALISNTLPRYPAFPTHSTSSGSLSFGSFNFSMEIAIMGIVKMKREFDFMHKGYPYGTDILYVYCDKCGSFSIKTYISIRKWLLIIAAFGFMIVGTFATFQSGRLYFSGIFFSLAICILAIKFLWGDTDYMCRQCGNSHIIINKPKDYASEIPKYNTLNYPSNMEVLDVPDHLTQKRYQGYWDDEYQ